MGRSDGDDSVRIAATGGAEGLGELAAAADALEAPLAGVIDFGAILYSLEPSYE